MLKKLSYGLLPFILFANAAFAASTEHLIIPSATFQQSGQQIVFTDNIVEDTATHVFPKIMMPSISLGLPVDKESPIMINTSAATPNGNVFMHFWRDDSSPNPSEFLLYDANNAKTYLLKQADGSDMPYANSMTSMATDGNVVVYLAPQPSQPAKMFKVPSSLSPASSVEKVDLQDVTLPQPADFPKSLPTSITYDAKSGNWYVLWSSYVYPSAGKADQEIAAYHYDAANNAFTIQGQTFSIQEPAGVTDNHVQGNIIALPNQSFLVSADYNQGTNNVLELVTANGTEKIDLLDQNGNPLKEENPLNATLDQEGNLYVAYQSGDSFDTSGVYSYVVNNLFSQTQLKPKAFSQIPIVMSSITTVMEAH